MSGRTLSGGEDQASVPGSAWPLGTQVMVTEDLSLRGRGSTLGTHPGSWPITAQCPFLRILGSEDCPLGLRPLPDASPQTAGHRAASLPRALVLKSAHQHPCHARFPHFSQEHIEVAQCSWEKGAVGHILQKSKLRHRSGNMCKATVQSQSSVPGPISALLRALARKSNL